MQRRQSALQGLLLVSDATPQLTASRASPLFAARLTCLELISLLLAEGTLEVLETTNRYIVQNTFFGCRNTLIC